MRIILLFLFSALYALAQQDTIKTAEGLRYVRLQAGTGELPAAGDKLKVRFVGKLQDGTVFESIEPGQSYTFKLGEGSVIAGWEIGFARMRKGEKGMLIIPPTLAYGLMGVKDPEDNGKYLVPPDATLWFEVELIDIKR
ncbi:MAG: FKBP-type peptidyl-prolyl cis-trans isomerase [Cytophagaceae bacterium]|jgi:FKBP-type peptidyl-prolyl cis-trans isomerase|nr:FKBP-type peptidyl-prolyl cis-trans isomerase [Cytophagaceae bacterium]